MRTMGEDSSAGENPRKRPALSDISNRPGKKGLLIIKGQSGRKHRDGEGHQVNDKGKNLPFVHKLCQGIENVGKEACGSNNIKGKTISNEIKGKFVSTLEVEKTNPFPSSNIHSLQDSVSSGRVTSDVDKKTVLEKDVNEVYTDGLVLSQEESSVGFSIIHTSQGSNSSPLERCSQIKEKCTTPQQDIGMIKDCRCSLCVKASYIWSDLLYEDFKGRISAIERSQKQAKMLAERNGSSKGTGAQHGPDSSSKLESDLMNQWMFLFQSTEKILGSEASQLEPKLSELKDLRENFRKEIDEINPKPVVKE